MQPETLAAKGTNDSLQKNVGIQSSKRALTEECCPELPWMAAQQPPSQHALPGLQSGLRQKGVGHCEKAGACYRSCVCCCGNEAGSDCGCGQKSRLFQDRFVGGFLWVMKSLFIWQTTCGCCCPVNGLALDNVCVRQVWRCPSCLRLWVHCGPCCSSKIAILMVNSCLQVRFSRQRWLSNLHVLSTQPSYAFKLLETEKIHH